MKETPEIKYTISLRTTWKRGTRWEDDKAKMEPWFDRAGNLKGLRVATGEAHMFTADWLSGKLAEAVAEAMRHIATDGRPTLGELVAKRWSEAHNNGDPTTYDLVIEARKNPRYKGPTGANNGLVGTPAPASHPPRYIARMAFGSIETTVKLEPQFDHTGRVADLVPAEELWPRLAGPSSEDQLKRVREAAAKCLSKRGEPTPEEARGGPLVLAIDGREYVFYEAREGTQRRSGDWSRIEATF